MNAGDKLLNTIPFIFQNKLWEGFFKHRLVLTITIIAAIVIPISFFSFISDYLATLNALHTKNSLTSLAALENFKLNKIFEGGNQYLLLLLIHLLNVYFSNKTIERLSSVVIDLSVKEMIYSYIRNLKVIIRTWFSELIVGIGIAILVGIFGPDWLEDILKFAVSSFFLGYIFIDNYNASFKVPIKTSFHIIKKHAGASFIIGFVGKILLLLPFIGIILTSFICGVAATWYMHTSDDRHAGSLAFAD